MRPANTDFYTMHVISYTSAAEFLTWIPMVGLLARRGRDIPVVRCGWFCPWRRRLSLLRLAPVE